MINLTGFGFYEATRKYYEAHLLTAQAVPRFDKMLFHRLKINEYRSPLGAALPTEVVEIIEEKYAGGYVPGLRQLAKDKVFQFETARELELATYLETAHGCWFSRLAASSDHYRERFEDWLTYGLTEFNPKRRRKLKV
jgi:hypothetical protein